MPKQKADGEDGCSDFQFHQAGEGSLDTTIDSQHRTDGSEHLTDGIEDRTDSSEDKTADSEHHSECIEDRTDSSEDKTADSEHHSERSEHRTDSSEDKTADSEHHSERSEHRTDSAEPRSGDRSMSRTFENQDTCTADRDTCQERTSMVPGVLQTVGDTSSSGNGAQSVNESDCAGEEEGRLRHSDDGRDMVGENNDGNTDVKDADKVAVHGRDNGVGEDFAEDQHSLSGPHRGHQTRRQQRRHSAATLPPPQRHLNLPASVLAQWRNVGRQWGVDNDDDIAHILMRHYEDLLAGRPPRPPPRQRCPDCGEVLVPLPCGRCGPHQHSTRLAHDPGQGRSSGGKGSSCGRC